MRAHVEIVHTLTGDPHRVVLEIQGENEKEILDIAKKLWHGPYVLSVDIVEILEG